MAFFGIFLLAWAALLFFIILIFVMLFIFLPCLVLFIVSLVNGVKYKWPIWTRIIFPITAIVVSIFVTLITWYLIWRFGFYVPPYYSGHSTSEAAMAINYLLSQIKQLLLVDSTNTFLYY